MTDQQPYFSVGEEVILVSRDFPEYNGEYTIRKILSKGDKTLHCRVSNTLKSYYTSRVGYQMEEILSRKSDTCNDDIEIVWDQSALRKKHKPAERNDF